MKQNSIVQSLLEANHDVCSPHGGAAKTHRRKLQIIQNKIIRMIKNAPWRTRIATLHEGTNIEPIEEFIYRLKDNSTLDLN